MSDPLARIDALLGLAPPVAVRAASRTRDPLGIDYEFSDEDQESIIKELGSRLLGGVAAVGNVLDTPGSAIRNLLVGRNPLPGLADSSARSSGRDVLEQWGILGKNTPGLDLGDVLGFGFEVATDPLTYLTLGGSAVRKIGKAAKSAGLMEDVAKIASRKAGRKVGPRVARMTTTAEDLLTGGGRYAKPDPNLMGPITAGNAEYLSREARLATAAEGLGLGPLTPALRQEKIGALLGIGLPGNPSLAMGQGPLARDIGGKLDTLGHAVRYGRFSPVNHLARLFNPQLMEASTEAGQEAGRRLFRDKTAVRAAARGQVAEYADQLLKGASENREQFVMDAMSDPALAGEMDNLLTSAHDASAVRRFFEGVDAPTTPAMQKLYGDVQGELQRILRESRRRGIDIGELIDPKIGYFPRYLTEGTAHGTTGQPFSAFDPALIKRKEFLKGIGEGTATIQRIAQDETLNEMIEGGATLKQLTQFIEGEYGQYIPEKYGPIDEATGLPRFNQRRAIAKWMASLSPETRQAGVFANHPLMDLQARLTNAGESIAAADTIFDTIAEQLVSGGGVASSQAARVTGSTTIRKMLKNAKLKPGDVNEGALLELARRMGAKLPEDPAIAKQMLDHLGNMRIRQDIADDMARFVNAFQGPAPAGEILKAIDSVTNFFRAGVTSPWPAFHSRNLFSGQFQNYIAGMFSAGSVKAAHTLLRGGEMKGAAEIPILRQRLERLGLPINDAAATAELRKLVAEHEVLGKYSSLASSTTGATGEMAGSSLDDLLAQRPGQHPFSFAGLGKKFAGQTPDSSLRPWEVRGVGNRTESRFGPVAAGQDLAHYVEGLNRLSPFIHQLKQGADPAAAAAKIGAAQVHYSGRHYTAFEREAMARLFPFYKFSRSMIPFTLRQLYEKPGGKLAQTIRAMSTARKETPFLPDYLSDTLAIPIPEGTPLIGPEKGDTPRFLTTFGMMPEDTLSMLGSSVGQTGLEVMSRLNPLLKGPLEAATNQSFFQKGAHGGRPLEDLDPILGRTLANVVGSEEPISIPGERVIDPLLSNSPFVRAATTVRQLTDTRKSLPAKAVNLLTGVRLTDVSPGVQDALLREAAEDKLKQSGGRTFQRTSISKEQLAEMSPEQQQAALQLQKILNMLAKRSKQRALERKQQKAA